MVYDVTLVFVNDVYNRMVPTYLPTHFEATQLNNPFIGLQINQYLIIFIKIEKYSSSFNVDRLHAVW